MAACLYIPVQNSEEEVRVSLDQLPRDATDILDILKAEQAPLDLWLVIAREYFKQGKLEQFRQILEEGSSPEIDEYYADVRYERIAILNALGAYYTYLGKIETKQKEREEHFGLATQYYNRASRIDMHEPSTWVGKGQLLLARGDLGPASNAFKIVLDGQRDNVAALLGQACLHFYRSEFVESLELYKRALRGNPDCPPAARLGLGLCRYKLGQFKKARQAFLRVLQLDPDNVEALVALGILELQTDDAFAMHRGMEKMLRAFEIYPHCSMALNYLANHFFFTGQHFLVEQLTETALAMGEHGSIRPHLQHNSAINIVPYIDHNLLKSHSYYNLARSYHSKGDFGKAKSYYLAAVNETKPQDFILPFYGLGQMQLKFGELRSSLLSFEKVLEVYPDNCESLKVVGHIYTQLGQTEKAAESFRKATRVDPRDSQAFLELGELLMPIDTGSALDALKTACSLLRRASEEVPVELLNNIGVLHFEKGEFELACQTFRDALGRGVWVSIIDGSVQTPIVDAGASSLHNKDVQFFQQLEEDGVHLELPWDKVTVLFNMARLLEQLYDTEKATTLYRFIIFKYPDYVDAYLRLAAMAKARKNVALSMELAGEALKIDAKCLNALLMLGNMELKGDYWLRAKETFRSALEAAGGKDSYAALSLGNWNYFAALRSEKKEPKLEAAHLEKAKELFTNELVQKPGNLYAANGAGIVYAEKGHFDVSKDIFTQVQEAATGNIFVQMPDVWINLAHVYFAQGQFALAVKMYQNCLRKFYYSTDSQVLLYLARTHYEAEQWNDCKKALLRAIHITPSNYALRFDAGVSMQKYSSSTLQKPKRSTDEIRSAVAELKNAVRIFSQLSSVSSHYSHGFDEKKIETHVGYCKHLLEAAKIHCEAAEREEQQTRQKLEVARQLVLAEEARRKVEEQRKFQMERRKQEDELKQVMQQEEQFERVKELWKSKRKDRPHDDEENGGNSETKRKKRERKRSMKEKKNREYNDDQEEPEADIEEEYEEGMEEEYANVANDREQVQEGGIQDPLVAAGLEDFNDEDATGEPGSTASRRRRALSDSDSDEPAQQIQEYSPGEVNVRQYEDSDVENGGHRGEGYRSNGRNGVDDNDDDAE